MLIILLSAGSNTNANDIVTADTMFIHRSWTGSKGNGLFKIILIKTIKPSAILVGNKNFIVFLILSYTRRPSLIASTIVEKLSSASTISDDSLATSVPLIPIEIPISACFNAGASLTPSPVIAVTKLLAWYAFTIRSLFSGVALANIS